MPLVFRQDLFIKMQIIYHYIGSYDTIMIKLHPLRPTEVPHMALVALETEHLVTASQCQ